MSEKKFDASSVNMSQFKGVTFTGADDNTNIQDLVQLGQEFDFVEFGILLRQDDGQGVARYPSEGWLKNLLVAKEKNEFLLDIALHICGPNAIEELVRPGSQLIHLAKKFDRVQLNMRWQQHEIREIGKAVDYLVDSDVSVITQFNDQNVELYKYLFFWDAHQVLFDFSGGNGKLPKNWPEPIPGVTCGYAGGLSPDNIAEEFPKIYAAAMSRKGEDANKKREFWIDMETGVRDEKDQFSIARCRDVLEYINKLY